LASKPNIKTSTTHRAEGNSMVSPTQTVVGKGKLNMLIARFTNDPKGPDPT